MQDFISAQCRAPRWHAGVTSLGYDLNESNWIEFAAKNIGSAAASTKVTAEAAAAIDFLSGGQRFGLIQERVDERGRGFVALRCDEACGERDGQ